MRITKELGQVVMDLITEHKELRNDYMKLYGNIWIQEVGVEKLQSMTGFEAMKMICNNSVNGELSPANSISRARRAVQKVHPHLSSKSDIKKMKLEQIAILEVEELKKRI